MKCCDCGLVHEAQFGVVRYKSEAEREDCEKVDDPNLQAVFRMRRSEEWTPDDTAYRPGGLAQPEQNHPEDNLDMVKARQIAHEYAQPHSGIDAGNLYSALHAALRRLDHINHIGSTNEMVTEQPQPEQEPPILTALNDRAHPKEQMTASTRPLMRRATREEKIDRPGVYWVPVEQPEQKRPQNCGTSYCSCVECVMEPNTKVNSEAIPKQISEQEPVAHLWQHSETGRTRIVMPDQIITTDATWHVVGPLYLGAPPRREWQVLTDEDVNGVKHTFDWASAWTFADFARAIEAKLREKNA